ncbi:hypothetical protein OKW41_008357 [Paraburkholderia sp. UCT70]
MWLSVCVSCCKYAERSGQGIGKIRPVAVAAPFGMAEYRLDGKKLYLNVTLIIKVKLATIDEMRPGSLTRQYKDPENKKGPTTSSATRVR